VLESGDPTTVTKQNVSIKGGEAIGTNLRSSEECHEYGRTKLIDQQKHVEKLQNLCEKHNRKHSLYITDGKFRMVKFPSNAQHVLDRGKG
jgi:hypothetical protein